MIRFTARSPDGIVYAKPVDPDCTSCDMNNYKCREHFRRMREQLAAYEDTGLTPAECAALKSENERIRQNSVSNQVYKFMDEKIEGLEAEIGDLEDQLEEG